MREKLRIIRGRPGLGAEAACNAGVLPPHPQDLTHWCLSRCWPKGMP
jgi:hypothetical protein